MGYSYDEMESERGPQKLLPAGDRVLKVVDMVPEVSKAGNDMFVTMLEDVESGDKKTVWLVSVKGKRWLLKTLLESCGIRRADDGNWNWDFPDVIGKKVVGQVEHFDDTYIDRNGNPVNAKKDRITVFLPYKDGIAWND